MSRTDGEPALVAMARKAMEATPHIKWKAETTPRYDYAGAFDGTGSDSQAFYRDQRPDQDSARSQSLAMDLQETHAREDEWHSAFRDTSASAYTGFTDPFTVPILHRVPHSAAGRRDAHREKMKADYKFEKGISLEKGHKSNEFMIGTEEGVVTARTVRRMEVSLQANRELLGAMAGVTWNRRLKQRCH